MADWDHFAALVKAAREGLDLTQEQAAQRSGGRISASNWRVVEAAGRSGYRPRTLRGIEIALGWQEGAAAKAIENTNLGLGQIFDRDAVEQIQLEQGHASRPKPDWNARLEEAPDYIRRAVEILLDGARMQQLEGRLTRRHLRAASTGNPPDEPSETSEQHHEPVSTFDPDAP